MKRLFILMIFSIAITSCSKDDISCEEIERQYLEALDNTGGNPAAIEQVRSQYEAKKRKAGCN